MIGKLPPKRSRSRRQQEARIARLLATKDLLDQAVHHLSVSSESLHQRLERSSLPLAAVRPEDLETEEELALHARIRLGMSQLRRSRETGTTPVADVPVFALEATASHIVDLRDVTTRRILQSTATRRGRDRRPK